MSLPKNHDILIREVRLYFGLAITYVFVVFFAILVLVSCNDEAEDYTDDGGDVFPNSLYHPFKIFYFRYFHCIVDASASSERRRKPPEAPTSKKILMAEVETLIL